MLIDTHAHLDYPDFENNLEEVIMAAHSAGVERIITIGTCLESSRRAVALAERFDGVYAVVGLHPTYVNEESEGWLEGIRALASHPKVAAIGETGMDYHRLPSEALASSAGISALQAETADDTQAAIMDGAYQAAQAEAFAAQLDLAVEFGLNVVIHQRDAWNDTVDILKAYTGRLRGVFHCFGNTPDQAREILALGHLVSFTGIVTFKNAALVRDVVAAIPMNAFMVETDCPYLAPEPQRGKRCEPAHTRLVAEKIAALRGATLQEIADATTRTAEAFFRL
ncbi:MAG: DNAase [Spartobacteria bacterium AMD-G4]|jgi:TatD DNase family protein|nr:MAG: DNAase [Spartobacteria bacterium AMD-G4]